MRVPPRVLCLWCRDWQVLAVRRAHAIPADRPLAVVHKGVLVACSEAARATGVRHGLRTREAQARCAGLELHSYDTALDALQFEPVAAAVEAVVPGVEIPRPGLCLLPVAGAARFYDGEEQVAELVLEAVTEAVPGLEGQARVGIADDPFTAELVARTATRADDGSPPVVAAGESRVFLGPMGVQVLEQVLAQELTEELRRTRLVPLLSRLGVSTLGDFAALPTTAVRERFGEVGAAAHAQARGQGARALRPRVPPRRFTRTHTLPEPLADAEPLLNALETPVAELVAALAAGWLACTEIAISLVTENGRTDHRVWRHPRWFTSRDLLDRLRWQLSEWGGQPAGDTGPTDAVPIDAGLHRDGIARVELDPTRVEPAADHDAGLWGGGPEEKVQHVVSGLQSSLGRTAVSTPTLVGGRVPAQRQRLVSWGDPPPTTTGAVLLDGHQDGRRGRTWPGSLPPPAPASVFGSPSPCRLYTAGPTPQPVVVDDRGVLDGEPALLASGRDGPVAGLELCSWAGPWLVEDRWWEQPDAGRTARLQVQDSDGVAWLLVQVERRWYLEARYD